MNRLSQQIFYYNFKKCVCVYVCETERERGRQRQKMNAYDRIEWVSESYNKNM